MTLEATAKGADIQQMARVAAKVLTVRRRYSENDEKQNPAKVNGKHNQCNDDVEESRYSVEEDDFQGLIDCSTTIQNAEDFTRLAPGVEGEGEMKKMREGELGHF